MDVWLDRDKICGGAHGALFLMDFVTNVASSMIWAFCYMIVQPRGNENVICFATCMAWLQHFQLNNSHSALKCEISAVITVPLACCSMFS